MPKKPPVISIPRTKAVCYVRKSYTRYGVVEDMHSPERQRANILAVCERNGWIPEWYEDVTGHKSGRFEKNRPAWLAAKARLSDPDIVALVANDLSRLHRRSWRIGNLLEMLDEYSVSLVLAAPGREVDTSTTMGRIMINFLALQDEAYANDAAIRAKDNIKFRLSQGKSNGIPPFGTMRNDQGLLTLVDTGAWRLPDGSFVPGKSGEKLPVENAIWRGYADCAKEVLTFYAENKHGKELIAYKMNPSGWDFCDRYDQPRPFTKEDVRRIISNWREYAGLVPDGKARDRNSSLLTDPTSILYDTGRSVFDLDLLRTVGQVQHARSKTTRPPELSKRLFITFCTA
jgi:DNA invertase Pin-like site-specific DNA recombinase